MHTTFREHLLDRVTETLDEYGIIDPELSDSLVDDIAELISSLTEDEDNNGDDEETDD